MAVEKIEVLAVDSAKMKELKMVGNDYLNTVENSSKRIMREVNRILRKINNTENMNEFMKDFYHSRLQMLSEDLEELNKSLVNINSMLKGE